ncbi:hypothetical protein EJ04DRAFT_335824 [Polyplosphaeria fusca]|uniref:Uncharacterized protein n=1 Tax=Polyplosphaeria fusca TaxID=682080 RepID=A0A9P4QTN3_9PLEO|nr:hypothetical protein EJ04DRAFT_335824 [Polyplosphaeria fusca]
MYNKSVNAKSPSELKSSGSFSRRLLPVYRSNAIKDAPNCATLEPQDIKPLPPKPSAPSHPNPNAEAQTQFQCQTTRQPILTHRFTSITPQKSRSKNFPRTHHRQAPCAGTSQSSHPALINTTAPHRTPTSSSCSPATQGSPPHYSPPGPRPLGETPWGSLLVFSCSEHGSAMRNSGCSIFFVEMVRADGRRMKW